MNFSKKKKNECFVVIDGEIIEETKASVSIFDRGFLFGEGVFTTVCLKNGILENFERHYNRLKRDCRTLNICFPCFNEKSILDLAKANNALKGAWRLKIIITKGSASEFKNKDDCVGNMILFLTQRHVQLLDFYKICLFPEPVVTPTSKMKTLAYMNRFFIKEHANHSGFTDAITTNCNKIILETAFSNIFWISNNILYTPSFALPLLKGTFLESLLEGAQKSGFPIIQVCATIDDIPDDANVFVCNSITGIQPVDSIESRPFSRNSELEKTLLQMAESAIQLTPLAKICTLWLFNTLTNRIIKED